jgi:hypothetical protein
LELVACETFGLLGPNGAGKTTTIHLLIGASRPDDGDVTINGSTDPTRPDVRRQIGVAPQVEALYDELSAAENLSFFGRLYGLSGGRLKERVSWCLGLAGLTARAGDRVVSGHVVLRHDPGWDNRTPEGGVSGLPLPRAGAPVRGGGLRRRQVLRRIGARSVRPRLARAVAGRHAAVRGANTRAETTRPRRSRERRGRGEWCPCAPAVTTAAGRCGA